MVRSAVMLKTKFAVKVAPSAMILPAQFVPRLQLPLASTFHVLVAASAFCGAMSVARTAAMLVLRILRRLQDRS